MIPHVSSLAAAAERDRFRAECAALRRDAAIRRRQGKFAESDALLVIADRYDRQQAEIGRAMRERHIELSREQARADRGWALTQIRLGALGQGPCRTIRESKLSDRQPRPAPKPAVIVFVTRVVQVAASGQKVW